MPVASSLLGQSKMSPDIASVSVGKVIPDWEPLLISVWVLIAEVGKENKTKQNQTKPCLRQVNWHVQDYMTQKWESQNPALRWVTRELCVIKYVCMFDIVLGPYRFWKTLVEFKHWCRMALKRCIILQKQTGNTRHAFSMFSYFNFSISSFHPLSLFSDVPVAAYSSRRDSAWVNPLYTVRKRYPLAM